MTGANSSARGRTRDRSCACSAASPIGRVVEFDEIMDALRTLVELNEGYLDLLSV